ncbi:hypothetical protein M0R19_02330 [Candidatus Pacearchaeota archaeon]|nr:hypothetical protein [Candidatus Pacearchaeota archaeon]
MEKENKKEYKFLVSIKGKNIDFEVPVNSMEDLERTYEILEVLRKKI